MPPRLAHKKSRKGCQRCKARKVKCNEVRPNCSACERHGIRCEYDSNATFNPLSASSTNVGSSARPSVANMGSSAGNNSNNSNNSSSTLGRTSSSDDVKLGQNQGSRVRGPVSPYDLEESGEIDPEIRRVLELQLLHHFVIFVVETFPATPGPSLRSIWTVEAVSIGFEHSFLLNAMFAISALHIAVEGVDKAPSAFSPHLIHPSNRVSVSEGGFNPMGRTPIFDYAKAHRIYLNRAVQEQRQALSVLSASNADAVCLTSIILSTIACKLIHEHDAPRYNPPVQWLSMANAIGTIVKATYRLIQRNTIVEAFVAINDPDFLDSPAIFNPAFLVAFQAILDFDCGSEEMNKDTREVYKMAMTFVGSIHHAIAKGDPARQVCRRIMSFAPMLPRELVNFLDEKRPRALVILAHLSAMAKYVEEYWWFRGFAEREVYGIQSILPPEWQWAMAWPIETLRTLSVKQRSDRQKPDDQLIAVDGPLEATKYDPGGRHEISRPTARGTSN